MIELLDDVNTRINQLKKDSIHVAFLYEMHEKRNDIVKALLELSCLLYKKKNVIKNKDIAFKRLVIFRSKILDIKSYIHTIHVLIQSAFFKNNYHEYQCDTKDQKKITSKKNLNTKVIFMELIDQIFSLKSFLKEDLSCEVVYAKKQVASLQELIFFMTKYINKEPVNDIKNQDQLLLFFKKLDLFFVVIYCHLDYLYWLTNFCFIHRFLRKHDE